MITVLPLLKMIPIKWVSLIKWIFIFALLVAIVAPYAILYNNLENLKNDNKVLIEQKAKVVADNEKLMSNNEVLKSNVTTLKGLNDENQNTIKQLLLERQDAKRAVEALSQKTANDRTTIDMMNNRIKELLNDPKNNGEIAPVLKETINNIQKARKQ